MMGRRQALFAAIAVAFFTAPVVAGVLGVEAERIENRRFASGPRLSQGWDAFGQTTRYFTDRMPLRAQAIRANTLIWTDVFGTDPAYARQQSLAADEALPFAGAIEENARAKPRRDGGVSGQATASGGRRGWLFLTDELRQACDTTPSDDVILQRWGELVQALRARDLGTTLFVTPHKSSIYPEYLPDKYPFDHCALPRKEEFWNTVSNDGPPLDIQELRTTVLGLKKRAGDELFELLDTHWTTLAALSLVDATLAAVGDDIRVERSEVVRQGEVSYTGDLSVLRGNPKGLTHAEYGIRRARGAPRIPGRTLLICDSFAYRWIRLFEPYFEYISYAEVYSSPEAILEDIAEADRVIIEANELTMRTMAGLARSLTRGLQEKAP